MELTKLTIVIKKRSRYNISICKSDALTRSVDSPVTDNRPLPMPWLVGSESETTHFNSLDGRFWSLLWPGDFNRNENRNEIRPDLPIVLNETWQRDRRKQKRPRTKSHASRIVDWGDFGWVDHQLLHHYIACVQALHLHSLSPISTTLLLLVFRTVSSVSFFLFICYSSDYVLDLVSFSWSVVLWHWSEPTSPSDINGPHCKRLDLTLGMSFLQEGIFTAECLELSPTYLFEHPEWAKKRFGKGKEWLGRQARS